MRRAPTPTRTGSTAATRSTEVRAGWGGLEPGTETDVEVAIAGRIMLKRDSGKLVFATIRDRGGELQLFISKAVIGDDGIRRRSSSSISATGSALTAP